jgi:hypothetical protein
VRRRTAGHLKICIEEEAEGRKEEKEREEEKRAISNKRKMEAKTQKISFQTRVDKRIEGWQYLSDIKTRIAVCLMRFLASKIQNFPLDPVAFILL